MGESDRTAKGEEFPHEGVDIVGDDMGEQGEEGQLPFDGDERGSSFLDGDPEKVEDSGSDIDSRIDSIESYSYSGSSVSGDFDSDDIFSNSAPEDDRRGESEHSEVSSYSRSALHSEGGNSSDADSD